MAFRVGTDLAVFKQLVHGVLVRVNKGQAIDDDYHRFAKSIVPQQRQRATYRTNRTQSTAGDDRVRKQQQQRQRQ